MNRQRKVLAGIVCVGAVGLAIDRFVLDAPHSGPQSASAAVEAHAAAAATEAGAAPALTGGDENGTFAAAASSAELAARLKETMVETGLPTMPARDAFAPSDAWRADMRPVAAVESADHDAELRRFRQSHRLMAVMTPGDRGVVVVNDRTLRVGRQIDGFTLIHVGRHSATFQGGAGEVTIEIDRPGDPQR